MLRWGSDECGAEEFVVASCVMVLGLSSAAQSRLVVGGEKVNSGIDAKLEICQVHVRITGQDLS